MFQENAENKLVRGSNKDEFIGRIGEKRDRPVDLEVNVSDY